MKDLMKKRLHFVPIFMGISLLLMNLLSQMVIASSVSAMAPLAITHIDEDTGISQNDGITSDNTLVIHGTATNNYTITLYLDGTAVTTNTEVSGSGDWAFDYTSQVLVDGVYVLTATERLTTTESAPSTPFTLTVDTAPPANFNIDPDDNLVNAAEATIFGFTLSTAEMNASYIYTITSSGGGTPITSNGLITTPNQSFDNLDISGLSDGDVTIAMTLEDLAGNTTPVTSNAENVVLDTTPPASFTITPEDNLVNTAEAPNFSFTLSTAEVNANYVYTITSSGGGTPITNNGLITTSNQSFDNLDISGLSDGDVTIAMTLEDPAGNTTPVTTNTENVVLDTTPPVPFDIDPQDVLVNGAEATIFGFTLGTAEVNANYTYTITSSGGGTPITNNGLITTPNQSFGNLDISGLSDGDVTIAMTLQDPAGNSTPVTTNTENVVLDTTPPASFSINPEDVLVNAVEATDFGFTLSTAEVNASYTYTITSSGGGTPITNNGLITTPNQSFGNLDISGLSDGDVTIAITLKDPAGNATPRSNNTTLLDKKAPEVQSSAVTGAPSNTSSTIHFVVQFTEVVLSVSLDDFTLTTTGSTQAKLAQVTGTGKTYTITVENVIGIGSVKLNVLTSDITDEAGNTLVEFTNGTPHQTNIQFQMFMPLTVNLYIPLSNSGFEDALSGWQKGEGLLGVDTASILDIDGIFGDDGTKPPLAGTRSALLGDPNYNSRGGVPNNTYAELAQEFTLPPNATTLSLQYLLLTHDRLYSQSLNRYYDSFEVYINTVNDNQQDELCRNNETWNKSDGLAFCTGNTGAVSGSTQRPVLLEGTVSLDVSHLKGQNITLIIRVYNRVDSSFNTWAYVDNIQITE